MMDQILNALLLGLLAPLLFSAYIALRVLLMFLPLLWERR